MLAMHFLQQLNVEPDQLIPTLPLAKAASSVIDMLDPADASFAAVKNEIGNLLQRSKLPRAAVDGATLAERLASWGGPDDYFTSMSHYKMLNDESFLRLVDDKEMAKQTQLIRAKIVADYRKGPPVTDADLDGLVALAGDRRPSRWLDDLHYRTIGDNALRALSLLLGCEPRNLIKRNLDIPWTDAERDITAKELGRWWKANQGKSIAAINADIIPNMPSNDALNMLLKRNETQRKQIFDAFSKLWKTEAPQNVEPMTLASILSAGNDIESFTPIVSAWPIKGKHDILLVAWHLAHGDGKPFDDLLTAATKANAQVGTTKASAINQWGVDEKYFPLTNENQRLIMILAMAYRYPRVDRLNLILARAAAPLSEQSNLHWLFLTGYARSAVDGIQELKAYWTHSGIGKSTNKYDELPQDIKYKMGVVFQLSVLGTMLKDQRLITVTDLAAFHAFYVDSYSYRPDPLSKYDVRKSNNNGLRVCDIAAFVFYERSAFLYIDHLLGRPEYERLKKLSLDFTGTIMSRNSQIEEARRAVAKALPPTLRAAGLPEALPGITDIPTGDAPVPAPGANDF